MPWMPALSAGQKTQVRSTPQKFEHYLLVNPNDIVWQAQINDTKTGENYASFAWNNEQSGVRANVMADMVCLITTSTTDFSDPVLRGRVRIVPDATTFYINEESINLTNSMYITVFDDFDIVERLARVSQSNDKFKDYSQTYQDLPPTIDGLQSVYADLSGAATVSWSFSPTATARENGAAIDSWLWDVGDGTITGGGVSTDQNITVSFPNTSEHRWVHLTVTDDNLMAMTFHFEVYTVDRTSATAVKLDADSFTITGSVTEGWNATIEIWDGFDITEVYDQTRCAIVSIDDYDGTATPIVSNIMMVGRLRTEENLTEGEEKHGVVQDGSFDIEGFGTQLARLVAQSVYIIDESAPDEWGQIDSPNPIRAIVYFLAWHTTFLGLSSFSADDFSGFTGEDWSLNEGSAIDHINQQAQTVNAHIVFAPAGESTVRRLASYTPTASRGGLTTVIDFTTADLTAFSIPLEYGQNIGEVEAGGVVYNTTLDDTTIKLIARAPAQSFGEGYESTQLDGQQLTADATEANARTELSQRASDHLAYVNPKERMTATLLDGFWWLIPNLYQRFSFTFAATDNVRGRVFASSDYWQLVDISYSPTNEEGVRPIQATFERETAGANAGILVFRVPDVNENDYTLPPHGPYDDFPDDPLTNHPTDTPDDDPYTGGPFEPEPPGNNKEPAVGAEILDVPMFSSRTDQTTNIAVFGEVYRIIAEGDGFIGGSETLEYNFVESGWEFLATEGSYLNGEGWNAEDLYVGAVFEYMRRVVIDRYYSPALPGVTRIRYDFDSYVQDPGLPAGRNGYTNATIRVTDSLGSLRSLLTKSFAETFGRTSWEWNGSISEVERIRVTLACSSRGAIENLAGTALINRVVLDSTGGSRGDAFYYDYNREDSSDATTQRYGAGDGLLLNGAQPAGAGPYQDSHRYEFLHTGNNSKLTFKFNDADYTDNDRNFIRVTVIGPNMSPSVL